ncbi:MAG: hypothetical protein FWE13_06345 [Firmicutes bacterium]|nr:hypothetical protein [Bacillota bacterium]
MVAEIIALTTEINDSVSLIIAMAFAGLAFLWGIVSFFILHKRTVGIEKIKAKLEKTNYVSKIRFDMEFDILKQLSETMQSMVFSVSHLFPMMDYVLVDEVEGNKILIEKNENAQRNCIAFQKILYSYTPFITDDLYKDFEALFNDCKKQKHWYSRFYLDYNNESSKIKAGQTYNDCFERTKLILSKREKLMDKMRDI